MQRYKTNRRFFYFVILMSILVALFFSIAIGLIILVLDIAFFYYIRRSTLRSAGAYPGQMPQPQDSPSLQGNPEQSQKVPCKFCGTLVDPSKDKNCPNCGAPVG